MDVAAAPVWNCVDVITPTLETSLVFTFVDDKVVVFSVVAVPTPIVAD